MRLGLEMKADIEQSLQPKNNERSLKFNFTNCHFPSTQSSLKTQQKISLFSYAIF
ncbi:hypothetical protein Syun_011892 [Stephania yunnanensis]|uniref:Uncharacterized protein n=1 Tax=Stephania yunnanensis TaxID=152371 RepID=A0AAP0PFW6_9MAGN